MMSVKNPSSSVPVDYSPQAVIKKIQFLINANHETVPAVARAIGVTQVALQDVLDGNSIVSQPVISRIANHFRVDDQFLTGVPAVDVRGTSPENPLPGKNLGSKNPVTPGGVSTVPTLNLKMLAVRHQALLELCLEKGVFTTEVYHSRIGEVEKRSKTKS